jgi:hypothetical protein
VTTRQRDPRAVFDPALPPGVLRVLNSGEAVRGSTARALTAAGLSADDSQFAGQVLLLAVFAVTAAACGTALGGAGYLGVLCLAALLAGHRAVASRLPAGLRRLASRYVAPGSLAPGSRLLLARAQAAAGTVMGSAVVRDGHIDPALTRAVLSAREWDIARTLRDADLLARRQARIAAGHDLHRNPVAARQQAVLRDVAASVAGRVEALEQYACRVRDAERAYRAWQLAMSLDALTGDFSGLAAGTAADGQAASELAGLHAEALAAGEAWRDALARCAEA